MSSESTEESMWVYISRILFQVYRSTLRICDSSTKLSLTQLFYFLTISSTCCLRQIWLNLYRFIPYYMVQIWLYFLSLDTWNTLWICCKCGGKTNSYATFPTRFKTSKKTNVRRTKFSCKIWSIRSMMIPSAILVLPLHTPYPF